MAKTISVYLSPEIIEDFKSLFDNKEAQRAYVYQKITELIKRAVGDVFQTKKIQLNIIENGKRIQKPSDLDEIGFNKVEIPLNPEWRTQDIAGKLVPFEHMVGDSLWNKITNYAKLFYITNKTFNESIIADAKSSLATKKPDLSDDEYDKLKTQLESQEKLIHETIDNECLEVYLHNLIARPIIEKIQAAETELLDKEEKQLVAPPPKPKRK